ncbi:MAG: hypothetical protein RLZZ628_3481, partial [Bacteroidota bacterium]
MWNFLLKMVMNNINLPKNCLVRDKKAFLHRLNRFNEISQIFLDFQCLKSKKICEISLNLFNL